MLAILWSPYGFFGDIPFLEWLADNKLIFISFVALALFSVVRVYFGRDTLWKILSETYGISAKALDRSDRYPSAFGQMRIGEDFLDVTIYQTPTGLLVSNGQTDPLLFPYERILRVRPLTENPAAAKLYLKKKLGPPQEIYIPWSTSLSTKIAQGQS